MQPLDLEASVLQQPYQNTQKFKNLLDVINSIDLTIFLQAIARISLCAVPNTQDAINNKHSLPAPQSQPTNNNTCSVRHVREVVLKSCVHILLLLIYHAKNSGCPALHRFM